MLRPEILGLPGRNRTCIHFLGGSCSVHWTTGRVAGLAGIEPTSPSSKHGILSIVLKTDCMERVARIELANKPWQGFRLPLHHTRIIVFNMEHRTGFEPVVFRICNPVHWAALPPVHKMVVMVGLEPTIVSVWRRYISRYATSPLIVLSCYG